MKAADMRIAFAVGEGEERRAGGVEGFEGVGGGGREVNNDHRISSLKFADSGREEKRKWCVMSFDSFGRSLHPVRRRGQTLTSGESSVPVTGNAIDPLSIH